MDNTATVRKRKGGGCGATQLRTTKGTTLTASSRTRSVTASVACAVFGAPLMLHAQPDATVERRTYPF